MARSTFRSEHVKKDSMFAPLLDVEASFVWQALGCTLGILHRAKSEQYVRFCSSFENLGRRGTFEKNCKDTFRVAGAVQETCLSDVGRSGR